MSIQAVAWVLAQPGEDLPGTARLVMIALANHADHTSGHCWPSIETIAKEAGCGERTASRYLGALRRNGFIDTRQTMRKNGKFRSNDYWILFDRKTAPWRYYEKENEDSDASESVASEPHANLADGHSETESHEMAHGPHATVGVAHIMLEPSGSEPSAPAGFQPQARADEQAKLQAAEEARKRERIPVIEGSKPWQVWIRSGHPATLTAQIEINGRRYRGWYFESLYPKSTGPPSPSERYLTPEDEAEFSKWG